MPIKRAVATLMTLAMLTAVLVVAPTPQVSSEGEVSIGYAAAEASHQPCRPTYWEKRPNQHNTRMLNYRVVLIGETLRPGGRWINCQYQARLHGFLISGTPSQGKFSRTVPHR